MTDKVSPKQLDGQNRKDKKVYSGSILNSLVVGKTALYYD